MDHQSGRRLIRQRSRLHLPITLSVLLMSLNIALMVCWIVLFAQLYYYPALAIGTVAFVLILVGLSFWLVLWIKEVRLNQRQANFVDSVTHELKSPLASLRLYLETLQMRELSVEQRQEFYEVMNRELERLDHLISQLLEVGRLDALGEQTDPEDIPIESLLRRCANWVCATHDCVSEEVFSFQSAPVVVHARKLVLEAIFNNLLDNAVKYGGDPPRVDVKVELKRGKDVTIWIQDNGEGIPTDDRKKIFRIFYRGGSELERRQSGTGLGLYIVRTLVQMLKGTIHVYSRSDQQGSVFVVHLPGRGAPCKS